MVLHDSRKNGSLVSVTPCSSHRSMTASTQAYDWSARPDWPLSDSRPLTVKLTVKLTPELLEKLTSSSGASLAITVDGDTHVRFMRKFAGGVCV